MIHTKKYGANPNLVYMIVGYLRIESCHALPPLEQIKAGHCLAASK
jgi:hypothetical protein